MENINITHRQFLALIRLAIGGADEAWLIDGKIDWRGVYRLAEGHCLKGLCFAGIERLPREKMPPMVLLMDWMGQVQNMKIQRGIHDSALKEFAGLMDEHHIPFVVFKGLAAASLYPKPEARTLGDVDFYIPQSHFNEALEIIERGLEVTITRDDIDKHYSFDHKGIRFEMHYQMETFGCDKHQEYFGRLVDESFAQRGLFVVDGVKVPMLEPVVDMMLVFKHWFTHLLGEGVGLRQTTDIAVLIQTYREKIDVLVLQKHLRAIGYLRAFDAVVALVEEYFHVEWEGYWQARSKKDRTKAQRYARMLMEDVLRNGNFGRSDYKHRSGKAKRIETTKRFFTHCWRYFPLAKKDILYSIPKRIAISLKAHGGK